MLIETVTTKFEVKNLYVKLLQSNKRQLTLKNAGGVKVKRSYKFFVILILVMNVLMITVLFLQNAQLQRYEKILSSLEVNLLDLEDEVENQVIPKIDEIQSSIK